MYFRRGCSSVASSIRTRGCVQDSLDVHGVFPSLLKISNRGCRYFCVQPQPRMPQEDCLPLPQSRFLPPTSAASVCCLYSNFRCVAALETMEKHTTPLTTQYASDDCCMYLFKVLASNNAAGPQLGAQLCRRCEPRSLITERMAYVLLAPRTTTCKIANSHRYRQHDSRGVGSSYSVDRRDSIH